MAAAAVAREEHAALRFDPNTWPADEHARGSRGGPIALM
jgi:hypothetical protein